MEEHESERAVRENREEQETSFLYNLKRQCYIGKRTWGKGREAGELGMFLVGVG